MDNLIELFESVVGKYYILFFFTILYIFISSEIKKDENKIILVYMIIFAISYLNILDKKIMIICFLVISFLFFEIFSKDEYKTKIIRSLWHKVIDYLYLMIAKYRILSFVILILPFTDWFNKIIVREEKHMLLIPVILLFLRIFKIKQAFIITLVWGLVCIYNIPYLTLESLLIISTVIFLFYLSIEISSNDFEIHTFSKIVGDLGSDFGYYKPLCEVKEKILIELEDKTFFKRKNDYTILCFSYFNYKLGYDQSAMPNKLNKKTKIIINYISTVLKLFKIIIIKLFNLCRGYSTIEMQLLRQIAIKDGYEKIYKRKPFEFVYAQLFFKGLKNYFKLNYKKVSDDYYKKYIMLKHGEFAPMFIYGRFVKSVKTFWEVPAINLTNEEFFLTVLTYHNGLPNDTFLDYDYLVNKYGCYKFFEFLKSKKLKVAIKEFKKRAKKFA